MKTNLMRLRRRAVAAAASVLTLTVLLAGCSDDMSGMPGMGSTASPTAAGSSVSAEFNQADVVFAQMMIPHHQQAVEMSGMLLAKTGVNPEITKLAEQIKAAQAPEITTMTNWLTAWGQPTASPGGMGGMDHGGDSGMMTPEDMEALDKADGPTGQRLYLEGMIQHHKGAVSMAEDEIANGKNPEAKKLAQTIKDTQNAEISTMQDLLGKI